MHILIIEDTRFSSLMIEGVLRNLSHRSTCVATGYDALEALDKQGDIDAVICDLCLPDIDGFKVFEETRNLARFSKDSGNDVPPFILLTSSKDPQDLRKAEDMGFVAALTKPMNVKEIEGVLNIIDAGNVYLRRDQDKSKIIVVDSVGHNRDVLHEVFAGTGYTLMLADSAQACANLMKEYKGIKMVITDMVVNDLNAMEVIAHIKSENPYNDLSMLPPMVLLTDTKDIDLLQVAYVSGFTQIIHGSLEKFSLKQKFNKLFSDLAATEKSHKTILLIDDVGFQCVLIKNMLMRSRMIQDSQYTVLTASSGFDALELLKSHPTIELVITDYILPDIDGIEIFKQYGEFIKNAAQYSTTVSQMPHFVLITASSSLAVIDDALHAGFNSAFKKPINAHDFLLTIEGLLQNPNRPYISETAS